MTAETNGETTNEASANGAHEALLRAGFPYEKTLGMRRVTWYPIDITLGDEGRVYCLGRFEVGGTIRVINRDDEDLGGLGGGWVWPVGIICDADSAVSACRANPIFPLQQPLGDCVVQELEQVVIVVVTVQQDARLLM